MRKFFLIGLMTLFFFTSCYQDKDMYANNARFKMFPTENIWTFLKLDTRSGKIWQVQYSVDNSFRGEVELNNKELATGDAAENGRFTLYQTKNMYNFILLDQIDGKMWQVQWSVDEENRVIIPV